MRSFAARLYLIPWKNSSLLRDLVALHNRRIVLDPRKQALLHQTEAGRVEEVVVRPLGYQWSAPMSVPKLWGPAETRTILPGATRYPSACLLAISA